MARASARRGRGWRWLVCGAPMAVIHRPLMPRCFSVHAKVFGDDQLVPTLELAGYRRLGAKRKVKLQEELDQLLRRFNCAALTSPGRLDARINSVLFAAKEAFQQRRDWRGFGCGWVFPRSAEMYSHPHYLAFIREDGSTDPPDLPFGLQRLLNGMRQQLLPFLEDVLEFGLGYEAGQLENTLQMTTAIVHYYPEMTQQETLLTPAAFHCDDSFLTLNVESTPGIHGLGAVSESDESRPRIRRFSYGEVNSSIINLFVGGYLQTLSQGRWRSLLHSGSNPSNEDRLSITIFLGMPQLHGAIGEHVHTRGEQERRVYDWLSTSSRHDDWLATANFEEIQDMYSQGDSFDPAVREWLGMARADICPTCQVPIAILHCYQLLSLYRCASHLRDFTPVGFPFHPISTSRLLERPREHISKSRQRHLRAMRNARQRALELSRQ
ncbi:unnamed protein product [Cladocopium goreaui]|uniref:Alpha-ketoglutarate-dependent dioxygenase alkB-like 3 n=1 Tax=Cladocopium goreaui TaxID=2562237 RepID=A0A9P1DLD3_9DINO|nr:unnamed protein product [Cladocopium goreaui]